MRLGEIAQTQIYLSSLSNSSYCKRPLYNHEAADRSSWSGFRLYKTRRDQQGEQYLEDLAKTEIRRLRPGENISQIPLRDKYIFCLLTRGPILVEKVQGAMSGRPSHQSADSTDLQIHFFFSVSSSWHYSKGMRFLVLLSQ